MLFYDKTYKININILFGEEANMGISKTTKTILIVDDNPANLKMAEAALEEEYAVVSVVSGNRALAYFESRGRWIDLILLDIEMPIIDGLETLKRIRSMEENSNVPVIFMTARNDRETVIKGAEMGIVDYIAKPFEISDVLYRVNRFFEKNKK